MEIIEFPLVFGVISQISILKIAFCLFMQTSLRFVSYLSRQSSDFKNSRCYVTAVSSSFQNIQKHNNRKRIEIIRAKTVPTGILIMRHSLCNSHDVNLVFAQDQTPSCGDCTASLTLRFRVAHSASATRAILQMATVFWRHDRQCI